jgi:hypothetical protein
MKIPRLHSCLISLFFGAATLAAQESAKPYAPLAYTPQGTKGQALVDMEMAKHTELRLITLHVTPNGIAADSDKDRCIMCSSIGRIGKPDNDEDIGVFKAGKEKTELATTPPPPTAPFSVTAAPKYEVMTPLLDSAGDSIGLAVIVFNYKAGDDTKKYDKIAHKIRDDFKKRVASKDDLLGPATGS